MIPVSSPARDMAFYREEIDSAIRKVLDRGSFILGDEVAGFENAFANYLSVGYAIGVASGTDALFLSLKEAGIGRGDEVIVPALTAAPTAVAVIMAGARPVFADVDDATLTISIESVKSLLGNSTRVVIPVHLYGNPADMEGLCEFAESLGIFLIEDACQAHGAEYGGRKVGTFGRTGCFSFYPTKNLGALGDGGMVVTRDEMRAERLRMMRDYGRRERDKFEAHGVNSRLDEIQAAVLRVRLGHLEENNRRRRELAERYREELKDTGILLQEELQGARSVNHLFVVRVKNRDLFRRHCRERGIETDVHYPLAVCDQPAFREYSEKSDVRVARKVVKEIVTIPMFPALTDNEVEKVITAVRDFGA